jgi:hypothetical protein
VEGNLSRLKGGCSCCSGYKVVVEHINSIIATDPWMIPIINDDEFCKTHTHGSGSKIYPKCPDCLKIKSKKMTINTIYSNHSIRCACGDGFSYGHKYIFKLLSQMNQEFIDNYTFDWCNFYNIYKNKQVTGEYDFVLKNKMLIIEMDGDWHRKDNTMSGQTKEESIFLDNEKDRLANEHGYKVIRISDECDIKQNILNSDLNILFDLSMVDWNVCGEFALSNRVKEACNYKRNNPEITTSDIVKLMRLSDNTIRNYLKIGNKHGWCNYNADEELEKRNILNRKIKSKKIEVFKDNISLGIFESVRELVSRSLELFGVKVDAGNISKVCNGERKHHQGLVFKFV